MAIQSIQKVIKVGPSLAVTIPAKEAKYNGIEAGDDVKINIVPLAAAQKSAASTLDSDYEAFKVQYGETLKNLADR